MQPWADLTGQILNQERLLLLCINYVFFSIVMTVFILLVMSFSQMMVITLDIPTAVSLLTVCFLLADITVADYIVQTMKTGREFHLLH